MTEQDRNIKAWSVDQGLRAPDDDSPVSPPERRAYASWQGSQNRLSELDRIQKLRRLDQERRIAERERLSFEKSHEGQVQLAREWAKHHGFKVGKRGRVSKQAMNAYLKAVTSWSLVTGPSRFGIGDQVRHPEHGQDVGTVITVEADPWTGEWVYGVEWEPGELPVPYRSGLESAEVDGK